jgi:hypothetical protein
MTSANAQITGGSISGVAMDGLTNISLSDAFLTVNDDVTGAASEDMGVIFNRGNESAGDAKLKWNETSDRFELKLEGGSSAASNAGLVAGLSYLDRLICAGDIETSTISGLSRIAIDVNAKATSSGDGIVLWNSDVSDNDTSTSSSAEALYPGTAPYNSGGDSPIVYITNESIEMHLDAVRAGNQGTTIIKPELIKLVKDGSGTDKITTITPDSASFANTLNTTGTATLGNLSVTGSVNSDLVPDGNKTRSLGSATKMWKDVYIGPGSLYIDGKKIIGSDAEGEINITTDDTQDLWVVAGGPAGSSSTTGDLYLESRGNHTRIRDTQITLGTGGSANVDITGTLDVNGVLEASSADIGAININGNIISDADSSLTLTTSQTDGAGYVHLNTPDVYVGTFTDSIKIDNNSITRYKPDNGDLNLVSNGTGTVTIDELTFSQFSAGGENGNKIAADENRVLMLNASGAAGYVYSVAPSFWLGDGASGAYFQSNSGAGSTLRPWGQDMHIGPYVTGGPTFNVTFEGNLTGNLTGNLVANATTEQLTTKKIISNKDGLTIPGVPAWGGFSFLNGGGGIASTTTPNTGYPFVGIQQSASGQSQPQAAYFINNMNYDISGGLAGHGVQVAFAAQDETGKLIDIASNLCKIRNHTLSGSAGSSTVATWDSEYTLTVTSNAGSGASNVGTNTITTNVDFTEVSTELRVVDKPGNSGSTALSGVYLTYDGAQTGNPSAILQLRDNDADANVESIKLEEARTTFGAVTKQYKASSDPSGEAGDTYFNTTTSKFRGHNGTAWVDIGG